jgi:protoporphyrinogen IX oxidase
MYEWMKFLHIVAVVSWFAGLFYLPRLFVYHTQNHGDAAKAMLTTMERKLYLYIMTPAAVATWVFGVLVTLQNPAWMTEQGWLHAKMTLVVVLTLYHLSLWVFHRRLADGRPTWSEKAFRVYNEVPTLVLLVTVWLVIFKPF